MEENKQYLNISPISKGKRTLAFLADFFINFILSFFIFNAAVMPISGRIVNADKRRSDSDTAAVAQFRILYNHQVMHYETDESKYQYNNNVDFTRNCYITYYCFDETDVLPTHEKYGKKAENEVIRHFFEGIRNDKTRYLSLLTSIDSDYHYFHISEESITLDSAIKSEMRLYYFSPNDVSKEGKTIFNNLESIFMNLYAEVFQDIHKNDLVYEGESYLANKAIVDKAEKAFQNQVIASTFISYGLSCIIYFLIIPLVNKNNKTIAMMMMHLERIGTNNLYLLNKGETIILFVYFLIFNIPALFFLPIFYTGFTYLFSISLLASLFFIGVIIDIASLVVLLISSFARSLTDYLSRSTLILTEDLDAIYRSKGYDI